MILEYLLKQHLQKIKYFLFLFLTVCNCPVVIGQFACSGYHTQRLSPDNGLSQGSNYFRYEDHKGYMWITANDAINRYDGSMVKVYNLKRYFKNCPPLQQGYGFAEDEENNIYIGSIHGLYIYHRNTDKFTLKKIFTPKGDELTMPFTCRNGYIWCFNKQYEIATYRVNDGTISMAGKIPLPAISSVHIYNIPDLGLYERWPFPDHNNIMWFVGKDQIFTMDSKTKKIQKISIGSGHIFFSTFYDKKEHAILIGTEKGLLTYHINSGVTERIKIPAMTENPVHSVCCTDSAIILSCDTGLLLKDKYSDKHLWLRCKFRKYNNIYALGTDQSGRVWICDDGFGQFIYNFRPLLLPKSPNENDTATLLKEKGVMQIAGFPNGDILAHRGILLDHATKRLKAFQFADQLTKSDLQVTESDRYQNGVWFVLSAKQKLSIYFLGKDKNPRLKYSASIADSIGICQSLKIINTKRILLSFSTGLFWLKDNHLVKTADQQNQNPFVINPISNNRCAVSYLNNDMWLIQAGHTDQIKFLKKILPGVQSFYLVEDTLRNYYWAGTNKGVYLLDSSFQPLKIFDADNGMAGTYIYGILLDDRGNAWCSHQRGLSSIDAASFQIINYDKNDGIQDWDYNNRACFKGADGTLYFGGVSGFNYFKPPLKSVDYYQPEVYIDEILVNNKIWLPDTNANLLQSISLPHNLNNITIKAIIKDLMYADGRQLVYRIKEMDSVWKQLSGNSVISFNSLAPGKYILELGLFDKYRSRALCQKKITISIATPYYRKSWFLILGSILSSVFIFRLYLRIKRSRQKTASRQKQALEQQRNRITADLHDDLGSSLSSLQINSEVAQYLLDEQPERVRKILKKIALQSRELSGKIGDMIWSMKPGQDEFMPLSSRVRNFAHDIMEDTNIHYQINIASDADTRILDITIRRNLVFIIKEAINNIVKYSAASIVQVGISMEKQHAVLIITDNGIGFDPVTPVSGNGLANMKKRAGEIAGNIIILSAAGKGTTIRLEIPLS